MIPGSSGSRTRMRGPSGRRQVRVRVRGPALRCQARAGCCGCAPGAAPPASHQELHTARGMLSLFLVLGIDTGVLCQ